MICPQSGRYLEELDFIRWTPGGVEALCPVCSAPLWWTTPDNRVIRWPDHHRGERSRIFRPRREGVDQ